MVVLSLAGTAWCATIVIGLLQWRRFHPFLLMRPEWLFGTAGLVTLTLVETSPDTLGTLWLAALTTGIWLCTILFCQWRRFRIATTRGSFPVVFILTAVATFALIAAILVYAARLSPHHPFPSLILGILSFFLPVNALAEVFHAGAVQRRKARQHPPTR